MRVHVVANQTARALRLDPSALGRLALLCQGRASLHVTPDVGALEALAPRLLEGDPELVVFAGGDGTFMAGVSALERTRRGRPWPRVGLLPGGTVGRVARNFGDRGSPEAQLARWLADPLGAPMRLRPSLRVRAYEGAGPRERVGFILGTGLVARFFDVYESRGAGGVPLAARIVARTFLESFWGGPLARRILDPMPLHLEVDGAPQPALGYSLVCAAVVRDLGLGLEVNYRAGEVPGRMHLVASSLPARALGPRAPLVWAGRSIGGPGHVDALVERFTLRFPDAESAYVLDGDVLRAREVEVSAGPDVPILTSPDRAPER